MRRGDEQAPNASLRPLLARLLLICLVGAGAIIASLHWTYGACAVSIIGVALWALLMFGSSAHSDHRVLNILIGACLVGLIYHQPGVIGLLILIFGVTFIMHGMTRPTPLHLPEHRRRRPARNPSRSPSVINSGN